MNTKDFTRLGVARAEPNAAGLFFGLLREGQRGAFDATRLILAGAEIFYHLRTLGPAVVPGQNAAGFEHGPGFLRIVQHVFPGVRRVHKN